MVLIWKSWDYILICYVFKKAPSISVCFRKRTELWKNTVCCSPSLISAESDNFFFRNDTIVFFWGKSDETALTVQWQIFVYSSFQLKLSKHSLQRGHRKTDNQIICRTGITAALTPLWHLCLMLNCCLLNITPPSKTLCGFATALIQTKDLLWWMHSVQQLPQKRKKHRVSVVKSKLVKNTTRALLKNSTRQG